MFYLGNGENYCLSDVPNQFIEGSDALNVSCPELSRQLNCSGYDGNYYTCGAHRIDLFGWQPRNESFRNIASCVETYMTQHDCSRHDILLEEIGLAILKFLGAIYAIGGSVMLLYCIGSAIHKKLCHTVKDRDETPLDDALLGNEESKLNL